MQVEISEQAYRLLQCMSEQRGDPSLTQTLDAVILESQASTGSQALTEEAQYIRALVDEGIRSAAEEPVVDGETFFQQMRARRSKAA